MLNLVLVGGGHASLPTLADARRLAAETGAAVTLVSDRPALWYSGMVPEWLGGVYTEADVTVPLGPICDREGVRFVEAEALRLDRESREVVLADGRRVAYDVVAIDVGAVNPGRERATGATTAKPLWHLADLGQFLDQAHSGTRRLAIVGGGAAGTEVALNVTARADVEVDVTVLDPGDRLCPGLPARLGRWAADELHRRSATVRLGARAISANGDGVRLDTGEPVDADAVLWATGSTGHPLLRASGLALSDDGFARTDAGLRALDDGLPRASGGRVFVAGDAASVAGHKGLARVGVHAVKQGPVLRENLGQALAALGRGGDPARVPLRPFRPYPIVPLLVSTGGPEAWWTAGPFAIRSGLALRLKHAVDRRWIDRYREGASYHGHWDARHAAAAPDRL
ncbi:NAD(P)/FAD-dependent oxidoreductase [Rubrivirga sp. IMCC45206]|uniref:NAD(P)/FAD-dependent oxidoreductase n=1 Tax=Rubrivirga sp. IMCC45206 TaxID=3391614 RepID=UPI00398F9FC2